MLSILDRSKILSFGKEINQKISYRRDHPCIVCHLVKSLTLSQTKILDSSKLREFADHNFKFAVKDRKFPTMVEKTVGKREIARYEQFLLFPQSFQKTCTADT